MRFGNKAGYNQLMAYDAMRPVAKPVQGKASLIIMGLIAFALGFVITVSI